MAKEKKFYETEKFKKLQEKWYEKLALTPVEVTKKKRKLGTIRHEKEYEFFVDIEDGKDEDTFESQIFSENKVQYDGGTDYRNFCEQLLSEHKFDFEIDKIIFQKHAEGLSEPQIKTWLQLQKVYEPYTQQAINKIIHRIKDRYIESLNK